MAKASRSVPGRGSSFESVFQSGSVKPPKQYQKFKPKAQNYPVEIRQILTESGRQALGIGGEGFKYGAYTTHYASCAETHSIDVLKPTDRAQLENAFLSLEQWKHVREWQHQLGGDYVRKELASVLDKLMTEFVTWAYYGIYEEGIIPHLQFWIQHIFTNYVAFFLGALRSFETGARQHQPEQVSPAQVQKWQEMAVTRLGALRVDELFDIIVDWDETQSGIDDLKQYATNPATRTYITSSFASALSNRLLHPGASTIEILQLYISIIRAFRRLDPKGVLLDRVARLIRRYLRDRDDTVRVIVAGLLTDPVDADGNPAPPSTNTLTELAVELSIRDAHDESQGDNELDWNNMEWVPDPIDAAPDYMKSKNTDVIGSLISLFDSKDIFVKELQGTLAERLLRNTLDFDQEIGVIEHLKIRFGDAALQGCEVMLRDVLDSRKVDNVIRLDQGMQTDKEDVNAGLHAKILSRLFWPSMQDQAFKIPEAIMEQQAKYEKGFETLKQSRKLTWLNSLGHVEVVLDLEDRVYRDEVLPWQAAIIYAFQSNESHEAPSSRTVSALAEALEMSPTLARSACIFWVSKRILAETAKETYTVLETLPEGDDAEMSDQAGRPDAAAAAADAAAAQASKEVEEAERQQKMAMYHQFILSMLTNQGAMPLPRIAMMLGIVVPGGFPFSNEELKEFLAVMVRDGKLEVGHGGAYKTVG